MNYNTTWIGIGTGAGIIVGAGVSGHIFHFVNCANPGGASIDCVVATSRLGLAVHMSGSVSLGIMTGISSGASFQIKENNNKFKPLESNGFDAAFDFGAKFVEMFKAGGNLARGAKALCAVSDTASLKKWAASEPSKATINQLTGNLSLQGSDPSFAMFGTPIGLGMGGGAWYEWGSVYPFGSDLAWAYAPINWKLTTHGGDLWLQVRNIPLDVSSNGGNKVGIFATAGMLGGIVDLYQKKGHGNSNHQLYSNGIVKGGMLYEDPQSYGIQKSTPPGGGINLSARSITGRSGIFGAGEIKPNSTINMGFGLRWKNKQAWGSSSSAPVKFTGRAGLSELTLGSDWLM